jgi:hypothetical protein
MASCAPTGAVGGLGTIQAIRACCSEAILHDRTHAPARLAVSHLGEDCGALPFAEG